MTFMSFVNSVVRRNRKVSPGLLIAHTRRDAELCRWSQYCELLAYSMPAFFFKG